MKVSHNEGPASHIGSKSCDDDREVVVDPRKRGIWTTVADTYSSLTIANTISTYVLSEWHSGHHELAMAPYLVVAPFLRSHRFVGRPQ